MLEVEGSHSPIPAAMTAAPKTLNIAEESMFAG